MTHNPKNQKVFQNTFKPKFKTKLKKFMENNKYKMSYWQLDQVLHLKILIKWLEQVCLIQF